MARYLLDTTVLVDLSKGVPGARDHIDTLLGGGHALGVCAVSVSEFMTGVPVKRRDRWRRFLDEFAFWETPRDAAELAGMLRHDLARRGITIHLEDAMIAGLALLLDAIVLTDNVRDFLPTGVPIQRLRR